MFYNDKQSGVPDNKIKVKISYDSSLTPLLIAPLAVVEGRDINFSENKTNSLFGVQFE